MINRDLGFEGEELVASWFESKGISVTRNTDRYDTEKDMLLNGLSTEVKTQTVYRKFPYRQGFSPAFTIPIAEDDRTYRNQLNKCVNIDCLIFVSRSSSVDPKVRIYQAPALGARHFTIIKNSKDNRYVAGFMISDMKQLGVISDDKIVEKFMDSWNS